MLAGKQPNERGNAAIVMRVLFLKPCLMICLEMLGWSLSLMRTLLRSHGSAASTVTG